MNTVTLSDSLKRLDQINEMTNLSLIGNHIPDSSTFLLCNAPTEISKFYNFKTSNYNITRYLADICFSNLDILMEQKNK